MHPVVENATERPKRRGRPPKYDREQVIDAAMETFWRLGVDAVTLGDLERATGVDRSTLYNSFDGKDGIYRLSAERYVSATIDGIFRPLTDIDDGIDAIVGMLTTLRSIMEAEEHPAGCLIVNDLASKELDTVAAATYRTALDDGVSSAAERAVHQGRLTQAAARDLGEVVVAGVLGANITSRSVSPAAGVRVVDGLVATVERLAAPA